MRWKIFVTFLILSYLSFSVSAQLDSCTITERGDVDDNGVVDLTDAIYLTNWLFLGGDDPPCNSNLEEVADVNNDGRTDLSDSVYLLNYLFLGGSLPDDIDHAPYLYITPIIQDDGTRNLKLDNIHNQIITLYDFNFENDVIYCNAKAYNFKDGIKDNEEVFLFELGGDGNLIGTQLFDKGQYEFIYENNLNTGWYNLEIKCEDINGNIGLTYTNLEIIENKEVLEHTITHLGKENINHGLNKIEIEPLQSPPPITSNPTEKACCEISCLLNDGSIVKTCEQTTEDDCFSCNLPDWGDKYPPYENANDVCNKVISEQSTCVDIEWKEDYVCNKELSPPQCEPNCEVDSLTIIHKPDNEGLIKSDNLILNLPKELIEHYNGLTREGESSWLDNSPGLGRLKGHLYFGEQIVSNYFYILSKYSTDTFNTELCKEYQFATSTLLRTGGSAIGLPLRFEDYDKTFPLSYPEFIASESDIGIGLLEHDKSDDLKSKIEITNIRNKFNDGRIDCRFTNENPIYICSYDFFEFTPNGKREWTNTVNNLINRREISFNVKKHNIDFANNKYMFWIDNVNLKLLKINPPDYEIHTLKNKYFTIVEDSNGLGRWQCIFDIELKVHSDFVSSEPKSISNCECQKWSRESLSDFSWDPVGSPIDCS